MTHIIGKLYINPCSFSNLRLCADSVTKLSAYACTKIKTYPARLTVSPSIIACISPVKHSRQIL